MHRYCCHIPPFTQPAAESLKPGLAWLTRSGTGKIQNLGKSEHDPEEDVRACVGLMEKTENGPGFGEFKIDTESIFERIARSRGEKRRPPSAAKTDSEVLEGLIGARPSHHFAFGRFTGLANALGSNSDSTPPTFPPESPSAHIDEVLATLDNHLSTVHPRRMVELNARNAAFESALEQGKIPEYLDKEMWGMSEDARALQEETEKSMQGHSTSDAPPSSLTSLSLLKEQTRLLEQAIAQAALAAQAQAEKEAALEKKDEGSDFEEEEEEEEAC
ncbi:uncharacterized protein LAESUDRAFT_760549 [Laetiporus sulphureus 93-53]|uniref:Uncharacterized protein n=1 Tax=Laetiporus sulphureus 93-53 TaxID=1314785 RepID=A0A165DKR9_9APHY|nr:uncharacterized protein LAESUDRAFT_760549 [Laetiporus sulphureus 93-53]KZT05100.1 hypothetical protein LAESUDRAFT_760549 [Laetiporus sulphureus 93-53]